jgi:hypothetical protein
MSRLFRSTLLVSAASMVAGLLVSPSAAYAADTVTNLTKAQMTAALKVVATASTAAGKGGWRAAMTVSGGSASGTGTFVVDPVGGAALEQFRVGGVNLTEYFVEHKGTYDQLTDSTALAAVKMIGRPSVRWAFSADKSLVLAKSVDEEFPSPTTVLSDDTAHPGTKTVHDDGSADYAFTADGAAIVLHADPAGVLAGANANAATQKVTLTYTYGAQKVTPPAAAVTVDSATLKKAEVYLAMADLVHGAALEGADHARSAAKGKTVKVASVRKYVRKYTKLVNQSAGVTVVKVKDIAGGSRVYATNPWTHKSVAYTVKASGKKVVVKKA